MRPGRWALIYQSGAMWFMLGVVGGPVACYASIIACAAWDILATHPRGYDRSLMWIMFILVPCTVAACVFGVFFWRCRRRRQALFRELWPHRLAVCPTCMYPMMRGRERCGECGREITRRSAQQFWIGVFGQPLHAILPEKWVIRAAANRRRNRGWSRRHFKWSFKKWNRGRPLLPLR